MKVFYLALGITAIGGTAMAQTDCSDSEGNSYRIVEVGTQTWMAENLRTMKYSNGNPIPTVGSTVEWLRISKGAQVSYEMDVESRRIYGLLYNWNAIADERGLCPKGWHVPTDQDWKVLELTLGMSGLDLDRFAMGRGTTTNVGGQVKARSLWSADNVGATNSSGFSAIPGGYLNEKGEFHGQGVAAYFVTSTLSDNSKWVIRYVNELSNGLARSEYGTTVRGYSCRCVKN